MSKRRHDLGPLLANTKSIPEYIQVILAGSAIVSFLVLWGLDVASVFVLLPAALGGSLVLYFMAFRIPAVCSTLAVHEHGLESMVQGQSAAFNYDELTAVAAKFTDHEMNHQYIGTRATLEFFVDGRLTPHVHPCEFRRGGRSERVVRLAIDRCSEAISRRLLVQLEQDGAVRWGERTSLTDEGLAIDDGGGNSRLVPYRQIGGWQVKDNQLRIWKTTDALPFFVMANDTPNFIPLFGLFQSLCWAIRNVEPSPA